MFTSLALLPLLVPSLPEVPAPELARLVEIPGPGTIHQFSSHNRAGDNGDDGWYLYDDDAGRKVIFDAEGPGCVRSIWATDIRDDTTLHFFFDGAKEPGISISMLDFFQGKHPLFPAPLVSYDERGYWGERPFAGNAWVPIPFAEGLRVAVTGELHFYHFLWESFPHGTSTTTFTGDEDRSFLLEAFHHLEDPPVPTSAFPPHGHHVESLDPGHEMVLADFHAQLCIDRLVLEADASDALWRETWIQARWDGHERSDVRAPLGYFFGSAIRPTAMHSLPLSVELLEGDRVRLTCRFPMAFAREGRLTLVNRSEEPVTSITSRVDYRTSTTPPERLAYFTTLFREGWTTYGRDWLLAETPGTGWYVGTVQTMLGEHYCEGDEHITLDGAVSPQINGTGTEDYYLGCFWSNREFNTPFACCVGDIREEAGSFEGTYFVRSCYTRYHLEAPIPFSSHLDARIQHGGFNTIRSSYGSLAFFYLRPRPALFETDMLDVGNLASEAAHEYTATSREVVALTARPEGRHHLTEETDSGRRHESGEITFTVAIDPTNRGVRLRRRLDQMSGRQRAEVFIDGESAGRWYHADRNPTLRWFDSDFDLHPRFTAGKSALEVKLVIDRSEGRGPFTDFRYRVFCFGD